MGYGRFKQKFSPKSLSARSGCKTRRAAAVLELVGPVGELVGGEFVIPTIVAFVSVLRKKMLSESGNSVPSRSARLSPRLTFGSDYRQRLARGAGQRSRQEPAVSALTSRSCTIADPVGVTLDRDHDCEDRGPPAIRKSPKIQIRLK